jgi:MFS family permease
VFHYSYTPDVAWTWTSGRFWLSVLPGAATLVAGFLVATTANRAVGVFAGYLGSAAGAWFIVGPVFGPWISGTGMAPGTPTGGPSRMVVEQIGFYSGLGAAVLFLAAQALGRFTVRSVLEVRAAERHERGMTAGGHRDTGAYPAGPDEPAATREIRPGEVHRT